MNDGTDLDVGCKKQTDWFLTYVTPSLEIVLQNAVLLFVLVPPVLLVSQISAIFISFKTVFHKVLSE
jgi:hypothetical protein